LKETQTDAQLYYELGCTLANQDKNDEAIVEFERALVLEPTYAFALNALGDVLVKNDELDRAIGLFDRAIAVHEEAASAWQCHCGGCLLDTHVRRAEVLSSKGELDNAIVALQHALTINWTHIGARMKLGHAFCDKANMNLGHFEKANTKLGHELYGKAISALALAIRIDQEQDTPHCCGDGCMCVPRAKAALGSAFLRTGQLEFAICTLRASDTEAEGVFDNVMDADGLPSIKFFEVKIYNVNYLSTLGHALLLNGETGEAVALLERAIAIDPDSSCVASSGRAHCLLSVARAENRDTVGAASSDERAKAIDFKNANTNIKVLRAELDKSPKVQLKRQALRAAAHQAEMRRIELVAMLEKEKKRKFKLAEEQAEINQLGLVAMLDREEKEEKARDMAKKKRKQKKKQKKNLTLVPLNAGFAVCLEEEAGGGARGSRSDALQEWAFKANC
jgi:tetratricopeptide (TPR) repeat protein